MKAGEELGGSQNQPSGDWRGRELSSTECGKVKQILAACNESGDLEPLIALASTTNGLIDDEVRKKACMLSGRLPNSNR